jgi:hypothetical protein
VRSSNRGDLTVLSPIETLCRRLKIGFEQFKNPELWRLDGYWPVRPRPDDGLVRFDRFYELLLGQKRAA